MQKRLIDALREAPFNLALSSGFFGFYAHAGFLSVLEDEQLVPRYITGSSAGALAGGLWASGVSTATMSDVLNKLEREHFWDPAPGLGLLKGRLFRDRLNGLLGVRRIEEAKIPIAISVFDVLKRGTAIRDRGDLATTIHASCAMPLIFQPVWIDGRPHLDGGILDRPGWLAQERHEFMLAHQLPSRGGRPLERRANTTVITVKGLPYVTPFALTRGAHAFYSAREATRRALQKPVNDVITV